MSAKEHRWSGAPGMFCLDCGNPTMVEDAINCRDCTWSGGAQGMDNHEPCGLHRVWGEAMLTCPPDPAKVSEVNRLMGLNPILG